VASAEVAQEALGAGDFDVLFTDVSLPGRSGVELAREAVRRHPGLRVIIASGHGTAVVTSGGEVAGAVLLPKPYSLPELKGALAQVEASRREGAGGR
jgi:DNA-binding NtrC family response regulator